MRVFNAPLNQVSKQGLNQGKTVSTSHHKYGDFKFVNSSNKPVKHNKQGDWDSISDKNLKFCEYEHETVKKSLEQIHKVELRKPRDLDKTQFNFNQEKMNMQGSVFNSDGDKPMNGTRALKEDLKGPKETYRSKSSDDGPFSCSKANFSECPSGKCELKWGEYDKSTKTIKF